MARLPMYRQIADAIREKISQGEYKVGEALPSERSEERRVGKEC